MKKSIANSVTLNIFTIFSLAFLFIGTTQGTTTQNDRKTDYKADQVLKSNAKINPSTLALEFAIPISGIVGRGGTGLPVMFNYSSKVWQIYSPPGSSWQEIYGTIINDTRPLFAKRTAAGWTSNLGVPRIDYEFQIYEPFRSNVSNYDGQVFSPYIPYNPNPPADNYYLYYVKRVQVTMPDGSTHEFRKDDTTYGYGTKDAPGGAGLPDLAGTFFSVDGSKMRLELAESNSTLYLPDGSRYLFGQKSGEHRANAMIDRNGNKMTYNATNRIWTDTLGRTIGDPMPSNWHEFEQNQVVEDKVAQFPSKDGGTYNVTFSWRYLKDPQGGESGLENISENLHYTSNKYCQGNLEHNVPTNDYLFNNPEISVTRVCAPGYSSADPPFNPIVLTKITLPNGQNYQFRYNKYGEISKIIYPTGGYERFQHAQIPPVQASGASYDQANRGVVERWLSPKGDGTDEQHWSYQTVSQYGQPYKVVTTNPDLTKTEQYLFTESSDAPQPYGFGNAKTGRSYEDRVLSSANQILKRHLTSYTSSGPQTGGYPAATRDLRPNKEVTITFEPGASQAIAQMTETIYDTNTDSAYFAELNPKQQKTYNFIVLDLTTAQTATIDTISALFNSSALATVTEMDYLYDPNYKARNINGLVTETRIKDANGNVKAKTQISYDTTETLLTDVSSTRWENPNTIYRGNVTRTRSWSDIAANQFVDTRAQYDQLGNLRNSWDARNNLTQTSYSSTYDYAYPTSVTTPIPDPSGQYGSNTAFTTSTVYDFNTGLPTSTTDINGQTTTIEYNDPLLRPTKVTAPNGQQTITEYGLGTTTSTRFVKVRSQIDETNWKEGYTWYDGIGRTIKTQSVDNAGDVFALTCYDNMGRVAKQSNPFRGFTNQDCSTANGTSDIYWTTNTFDTAGRPWKITTPDNAVVETTYDLATSGSHIGTVVTVKDQALKERRSITNALGALVRVDEPNASGQLGSITAPNQPTVYAYDVLNNLLTVTQNGSGVEQCGPAGGNCFQTRTFNYNSLSRLTSAANPESGTINYGYDSNGNLTSKIDARGVKTDYIYDALNRVTNRNYSTPNGTPGTGILANYQPSPNVTYSYDGVNVAGGIANSKGKLTKVASSVSTTEYMAFDILGRVTRSKQTTDGVEYGGGTDSTKWMTYTYNLSGALIEQQYPSGRVVKNTLDTDGSLQQVQSRRANDTFRNYANAFTYTAAGAVSSMRLGNGRWENTAFNSRLQPTQIGLGASGTNTSLLKLNYDYGSTQNNGNVLSQTITVPIIGGNAGFTALQTYTYDSLNRLKSATENIDGNQTPSWKQTYTFDRYGNRRFDTANTTTIPASCAEAVCNPQIDTATNKLVGYQFDNAGNTKVDANGQTFIYDSENKQVAVTNGSGAVGEYFYDGDGKRVKKVVPSTGETTIFVYDAGGKSIAEYSTMVEPTSTAKVSYLTNDHLGSPRITTDAVGQVISRRDFRPFGEEIARASNGTDSVRKKFTGYELDAETGLDFAEARNYASNLGRFLTIDPSRKSTKATFPQTWNRYSYCYNNPLVLVDKNGKWPSSTHDSLIETSFKGLSAAQLSLIKLGSRNTDYFENFKPGSTLWPSEAYKHAMTPDDMTPKTALETAHDYLNGQLRQVKTLQRAYEAAGGTGLSPLALVALGEATHVYEDMTSPAHGFDKKYKIPTMTIFLPNPLDWGGEPIAVTVIDAVKWKKELDEHNEQESGMPTDEQRATTALYSRAFFLVAFGEEQFKQLEMTDEERKAARALADQYRNGRSQ